MSKVPSLKGLLNLRTNFGCDSVQLFAERKALTASQTKTQQYPISNLTPRIKQLQVATFDGVMDELVECQPLNLVAPGLNPGWSWMLAFTFVFSHC